MAITKVEFTQLLQFPGVMQAPATDAEPTPGPDPTPDGDPTIDGNPAEDTDLIKTVTAASDARRILWPWVAKRTRPQVVALILISCLALGPIVALVSILRADPTPIHTLIEAPLAAADVTEVTVTALGLSPSTGELRVRVSTSPAAELTGSGGLVKPISVVIGGGSGLTTRDYLKGESPTPFEVALPLSEGTPTRYPFDHYRGTLFVFVTEDSSGGPERRLVTLKARSVIEDFALSASPTEDRIPGPEEVKALDWSASRPATTTVYAIWLMILMWGLAVTGLLIVWAVVIWMVDIPFWTFGYFVGVLFALPPLRDSLPGRPPPGTIFDFGSFYWSITIIGVNLILLLSIWLRRTHSEERLRSLDRDSQTDHVES